MAKYFLRTARLGFRRWSADDVAEATSLWGDRRVTEFIDARDQLTADDVVQRLASEIACERQYGVQYFPMFLLETAEFIGCCGLRPYQGSTRVLEVGMHIRAARWHQGFAFEAATAVVGYAFEVLEADTLFMGHHPANARSESLIRRLGFRFSHLELFEATGLEHPSYLLHRLAD